MLSQGGMRPTGPPGLSWGCHAPCTGLGGDRKGPQRGRYVPLSEDEEEMERESSCSCRSACRGGCG